jgi:hypothetical protein
MEGHQFAGDKMKRQDLRDRFPAHSGRWVHERKRPPQPDERPLSFGALMLGVVCYAVVLCAIVGVALPILNWIVHILGSH